jgi:predicted DNA-binding protein (MmcQ/YjbR family)
MAAGCVRLARMNAERIRAYLLTLPHVVETQQWGGLVFWVGDKAVGGKMFVMMNPEGGPDPLAYPAGPERFHELLELEGLRPAPYLARMHWVAVDRWDVFRMIEWERELGAAHAITYAKLPPKTKAIVAQPRAEQKRQIAERRKTLAEREAAKKAAPKAAKRSAAQSV